MASRTNAVSLRLSETDRSKLKTVADRLDVREADVLRYAIDITLSRLGPLLDKEASGVDLLPVFVESGADLLRFFSIDSRRLEAIINEGVSNTSQLVEQKDIALLVRSFREEAAAMVHLNALLGNSENSSEGFSTLKRRFHDYLYRKYFYQGSEGEAAAI